MEPSGKSVPKIFSRSFLPITTTEFYMKILPVPVLLVPVAMDLSALKMTFAAVSYTHLDVYKRQTSDSHFFTTVPTHRQIPAIMGAQYALKAPTSKSVSYTHLIRAGIFAGDHRETLLSKMESYPQKINKQKQPDLLRAVSSSACPVESSG